MALTVEITKPNGSVFKTGLTQAKVNLSVLPGDTVRLVDTTTGKTPSNIMVKKIGDGLLVDGLPNGQLVEIKDFYTSCSPTNACALKIDGVAGSADTIITQVSQPISLLPDNQALMYGADSSQGAAALAADGGAAGGAAAAGGVSSGAWLAGLAGLGLAAAAGGGGGGGSSPAAAAPAPTPSPGPAPAPADTTPPSAPVAKVDVASDSGTSSTDGLTKIATPTISGTAEAGATVTVSYTDASDVVQTLTTTAASDGSWHVDLASALKEGANTVTVTATDAAGNVSSATSVVVTLDTIAPTGLVAHLDTATDSGASHSDGITNNIHPTLSGTGTAGDMITVSYTDSGAAAATATAVVDSNGNWTVSPTSVSQNATTAFSVTETDAAGNVSTPVAVNVTVDTTAPAAPVAHLDASTDTGVAGDGRTTSLQPVISGTGAAGDQIAVTFTDAASQSHTLAATVAGNGTWSVAAANNILTNADTVFSATETDTAGNVSAATSVTVHQDTAATSTGGADVIVGGAGQHVLAGGGGDDVLVAGLAGETRNSQFEYWNIGNASGVFQTGPDYAALTNPSNIGWTIQGTTPAVTHNFGANGTHATDGPIELLSVANATHPDTTGTGGHFMWDTTFDTSNGGGAIAQTLDTVANQHYTLAMQITDPESEPLPSAFFHQGVEVSWDGQVIAFYDGFTHTWTGQAPTSTAVLDNLGGATDRVSWSWDVTGHTGASATDLQIRSFGVDDNFGVGLRVDRVTVTSATADGNNTLAGGDGSDLLKGGSGDDILYGGNIGDTGASVKANPADVDGFAFSLTHANGNDVIKDFHVGVDKLILTDVLDTYNAGGASFDAVLHPDVTRTPDSTDTATTTTHSDYNLSFHDVLQADSARQYVSIADDGHGNVKLSFHGADTGADLGSVVLEGVQFGSGAGQYDSVQKLMDTGYVDPSVGVHGSGTAVLHLTMDGMNHQLLQNTV